MTQRQWIPPYSSTEHQARMRDIELRRLEHLLRKASPTPARSAGEGGAGIVIGTGLAWGLFRVGPELDPVLLSFFATSTCAGIAWTTQAVRRTVGVSSSKLLRAFFGVSLSGSDSE